MNNNELYGLKSNTRKGSQTGLKSCILGLTCCPTWSILQIQLPNNEKETHGNGASQRALPIYWLDHAHAQTSQGHSVCVCGTPSWRGGERGLLCSLVESRADEPRAGAREASHAQKIKPPCGWPPTIQYLVAVCLLLKSCEPGRSRPRDSLPVFSIHRLFKYDKVLHIRNMGER